MSADRNLLLGILALQLDFISRDGLIAAMNAWVLAKHRPLADVLVDQRALTKERRVLLEALVQEHLKQHGDDTDRSLAAISSVRLLRDDLQRIKDPDLQASLMHVSHSPDDDVERTEVFSAGALTSAGQRFRVLRPHARGGLGEVFVAEDEELHREVALKEIQSRHADDPQHRARFLIEAQITGGLEHPGIVPVYGLGSHPDGRPFYAMRFIRGESLQSAIESYHKADRDLHKSGQRAVAFHNLLRRFIDVCNAIEYAHSRGIIHRDLKPGNVMLGKYGETLVVDWGLAKSVDRPESNCHSAEVLLKPSSFSSSGSETQMGAAVGTPQYMSPEQASGRLDLLSPATDVYGLGATLYCLLTGQMPFADEAGQFFERVQRGDFRRPRQVSKEVPLALEAICLKAMALEPTDRYSSARDLTIDIEAWNADERVKAYRDSRRERLARWMRHHRTAARACIVSAVVISLVMIGATLLISEQRRMTAQHRQNAELRMAETKIAREAEQTHRYYELLNRAREGNSLRHPGWTWKGLRDLREASQIKTSSLKPVDVRTEVATCLAGIDLREIGTLAENVNPYCLAFSPDGRQLALGASRSLAVVSVFIYDVESRQKIDTLQFPSSLAGMLASKKPDGVASINYTPDGRWLLVGSRGGAIHAWDMTVKPTKRYTWQAADTEISSLVSSRDSQRVFSITEDEGLKSWQIPSKGTALASLKTTEAYHVSTHPDGQTIACNLPALTLLNSDTLQSTMHWAAPMQGAKRSSFSPNGLLIAADFEFGKELRLISVKTGEVVRKVVDPESGCAHDGGISVIDFSPDGALMVTVGASQLKIWDVASGILCCRLSLTGAIYPVFNPNGRQLATTANNGVLLFEVAGLREQTIVAQQDHPIRAMDVSTQTQEIVCVTQDVTAKRGAITRWNLDSGSLSSTLQAPENVTTQSEIALGPSGEYLALTCPERGILLWHAGDPTPCAQRDVAETRGLSFSRDGARLWGGAEGQAKLFGSRPVSRVGSWSVPDLTLASEWANTFSAVKEGVSEITSVAAGDAWIVAGSADETIKLLDAQRGEVAGTVPLSQGRVLCVAMSPRDTFAVAGTERGALGLVHLEGRQITLLPNAHSDQVSSVAFSHDGHWLASASRDRAICLWRVGPTELELLLTLRTSGPVVAVRFDSTASKLVYLTSNETAARIWNLDLLRAKFREIDLDWK